MSEERSQTKNTADSKKKRKKRKKRPLILRFFSSVGQVILVTFLSFFLLFLLTGTICGIAATAYVMNYMEETQSVSIQELTMSYRTNIYEIDKDGEPVNVYSVQNEIQRIPVDLDVVPQYVRDAFVYAEDERFYQHEGVDYKRTAASFANLILQFWNTDQGGSTITQQLVKNLTGDKDLSPQRKLREIYRAMQLEKTYSKDEILENYINFIGFGGSANGVELAADKYFGKHVGELTVAEAACLAAIPQSPEVNNPFAGEYKKAKNAVTDTWYYTDEFINSGMEANRARREYILSKMYENGALTFDDYQHALNEHLIFKGTDEYNRLHPEEQEKKEEKNTDLTKQSTSWTVDKAINELTDYFVKKNGVSKQIARERINSGGYQIYLTVDREMQAYVEQKYLSMNNLLRGMSSEAATTIKRDKDGDGVKSDEEALKLQSAFTAIDYNGNILCTVGMVGEKQGSLGTNFAAVDKNQPGSAIKPVSTYGFALKNDLISWGTKVLDAPPLIVDGNKWPTNYSESGAMSYSNSKVHIYKALEVSKNTIPALIAKTYGIDNVFEFSTETLGLDMDDPEDRKWSPICVGGMNRGVTVEDLVNAYMVYGNGGFFSNAHIISRVETVDGGIVYAGGDDYTQVIDSETSYVMNKLLQNVINGQQGTGKKAKLYTNKKQIPLAGKTGTTTNWTDLFFVGLTPDFVSGTWIGYPENRKITQHGVIASPAVWKNIIGDWIVKHWSGKDFPECKSVVTGYVCPTTGKIASSSCGKGVQGWWKSTNAPVCQNHKTELGLQPYKKGEAKGGGE
ncbi:MAG: transglycosylase domain-containing protein [Oscillospiraceae bacterium]|nr:transglycosylase domain-containing protein [Oscillospiraceae bacterium]